ncbi:MAG: hypothetical protein ACLR78_12540 [Roseburia sp.]
MIWEREGSTYIVLDGETLLTSRHETIPFEELSSICRMPPRRSIRRASRQGGRICPHL